MVRGVGEETRWEENRESIVSKGKENRSFPGGTGKKKKKIDLSIIHE